MTTPDLPQDTRDRLSRIFSAYADLSEVVLYGSRATGRATPRSDIDLATRGIIGRHRLARLALDLEESDILQKCDIQAYEGIQSESLRRHIDHDGIRIYRAATRAETPG